MSLLAGATLLLGLCAAVLGCRASDPSRRAPVPQEACGPGLSGDSTERADETAIATEFLERIKPYVAVADADSLTRLMRDSLRLLPVASGEVGLVNDSRVCEQAAQAFRRVTEGGAGWSGRVYVVRAGPRFVVWDPSYYWRDRARSFSHAVIFSARWERLAGLVF